VTISAVEVSTLPTGRTTNFDKLHKDLILINWCSKRQIEMFLHYKGIPLPPTDEVSDHNLRKRGCRNSGWHGSGQEVKGKKRRAAGNKLFFYENLNPAARRFFPHLLKSTRHPEEGKPEHARVWRLRDPHVILNYLYCRRSWFCLNLSDPEDVTKICVSAVKFKYMNFKTLIFSILKILTALILLTVTSQDSRWKISVRITDNRQIHISAQQFVYLNMI